MLVVKLAKEVDGQWLAEHLSGLLGQTRSHPDDQGPPFHEPDREKWQLDRGNNYWLFGEGGRYRAMARYTANREKLDGFVGSLRLCPEIEKVTVDPL
ncbi:MAG: hypothetical protein U9Q03_03675 [Patescibacteria group bacterium]|nr:hypothetical protein [Patescibacteria group bacterium]